MKWTQRGVAAVELALVLPTFLILLGVMVTLGRAYWAEYIMLDVTSLAVRACVLQQQPVAVAPATSPSNPGPALTRCANAVLAQEMANYTNICGIGSGGTPTIEAPVTLDVTGGYIATNPANRVQMLRATLSCKIPVLFFVAASPSIPLVATSAMPFFN